MRFLIRTVGLAAVLACLPCGGAAQTITGLRLRPDPGESGDGQSWFAGRQLPRPILLHIDNVPDELACHRTAVVFRPSENGHPSPDTAYGAWSEGRCRVETRWNLADRVGRQHLKATLDGYPDERVVLEATGRQGARVFFGVAYTPRQDAYTTLVKTSDTAVVQAGDTTRFLTYDSTSVRSIERRAGVFPIVGVDFPLWPSVERLRLSAAMSVREDRIFFFGMSGLQAFVFGESAEASAIDLHLGLQLSRRDVGFEGAVCAPARFCSRSDLRVAGVTFLLTVDSASAFRGLASTLLR
ncbi:MAG: hypothetical protein R3E10_00580 [Gemmatimonadota bacterium]